MFAPRMNPQLVATSWEIHSQLVVTTRRYFCFALRLSRSWAKLLDRYRRFLGYPECHRHGQAWGRRECHWDISSYWFGILTWPNFGGVLEIKFKHVGSSRSVFAASTFPCRSKFLQIQLFDFWCRCEFLQHWLCEAVVEAVSSNNDFVIFVLRSEFLQRHSF